MAITRYPPRGLADISADLEAITHTITNCCICEDAQTAHICKECLDWLRTLRKCTTIVLDTLMEKEEKDTREIKLKIRSKINFFMLIFGIFAVSWLFPLFDWLCR